MLRLGWNPRATGPSLLDTLLPWRDKPRARSAADTLAPSRSTELPQFPAEPVVTLAEWLVR